MQNIRTPLKTLPSVLSIFSETLVGLGRISEFLTAEELQDSYIIDPELPDDNAIQVHGSFTWETTEFEEPGPSNSCLELHPGGGGLPTSRNSKEVDHEKMNVTVTNGETPFQLNDLRFAVKRGAFVAIIGRVGSGKVIHPHSTQLLC
jgi:ATP-binding cassette subfamily C (CFTR/MRP) protein 1